MEHRNWQTASKHYGCRIRRIGVAFSQDGKQLAACGNGAHVFVFSLQSGKKTHTFDLDADCYDDVTFSPDGTRLAAGSRNNTVLIWSLVNPEDSTVLTGHEDMITGVAFSKDGKLFASASFDGRVIVRDTTTWEALQELVVE